MSTEILTIDEVTSGQADKFVTHNEGLRQLEGRLIHVLSKTNSGAPVSPSNGDTYIVDSVAGDWSAATLNDIAHYYGGAWHFYTPVDGMRLGVDDTNVVHKYDGVDWDSQLLETGTGTWSFSMTDNTANAFDIVEGANEYLSIDTTNSSELITFGNATTNPGFTFVGSGVLTATSVAATITTAAQPNITSLGTLTALNVTGDSLFTLTDNTANAFDIVEGANEYLSIDTTNSSELITFGEDTTFIKTLHVGALGAGDTVLHIEDSNGPVFKMERTGFPTYGKWESDGTNLRFGTAGGAGGINFISNDVIKMVMDTTGNLDLDGGIQLTNGSDILDTYEEGTWTPELWDDTLATEGTPPTYTVQVGTYTRVGDMVHVQGALTVSALGGLTTTETARIGALPFTSENVANSYPAANISNAAGLNLASAVGVTGRILSNVNYINLKQFNAVTGTGNLLISEFSATGDVSFSATYKV